MKLTTSVFSVVQRCQVYYIIVFYLFYFDLKGKGHIRRKHISEKDNCTWNQYDYFDLPKIRLSRTNTTKNIVAFALIWWSKLSFSPREIPKYFSKFKKNWYIIEINFPWKKNFLSLLLIQVSIKRYFPLMCPFSYVQQIFNSYAVVLVSNGE